MSDVFISYAREDERQAGWLAERLGERGWSVFWDRTIPPGGIWDEYIGAELDAARAVIVLWSETAVASPYVKEEAREGRERGVLVPALLEDVRPPFGFRGIQAAPLLGWSGEPDHVGLGTLVSALSAVLGEPVAAEDDALGAARPAEPSTGAESADGPAAEPSADARGSDATPGTTSAPALGGATTTGAETGTADAAAEAAGADAKATEAESEAAGAGAQATGAETETAGAEPGTPGGGAPTGTRREPPVASSEVTDARAEAMSAATEAASAEVETRGARPVAGDAEPETTDTLAQATHAGGETTGAEAARTGPVAIASPEWGSGEVTGATGQRGEQRPAAGPGAGKVAGVMALLLAVAGVGLYLSRDMEDPAPPQSREATAATSAEEPPAPDATASAARPQQPPPTRFIEPEMVLVPAGSFQMGSEEEDDAPDERPVHTVTIARPFLIGKYEVTFEEYDAFASATGRPQPGDMGWGRGRLPVINVSWHDATAYAAWLSEQTGQRYRLPSEAEWEYAARAGTRTRYWWGDDWSRRGRPMANCVGCNVGEWDFPWNGKAAPVGQYEANPFGLHDVHGNVSEWVGDCWHGSYEGAPGDGSAWLEGEGGNCRLRVRRGGSWNGNLYDIRIANRGSGPANETGFRSHGFRLVQDP